MTMHQSQVFILMLAANIMTSLAHWPQNTVSVDARGAGVDHLTHLSAAAIESVSRVLPVPPQAVATPHPIDPVLVPAQPRKEYLPNPSVRPSSAEWRQLPSPARTVLSEASLSKKHTKHPFAEANKFRWIPQSLYKENPLDQFPEANNFNWTPESLNKQNPRDPFPALNNFDSLNTANNEVQLRKLKYDTIPSIAPHPSDYQVYQQINSNAGNNVHVGTRQHEPIDLKHLDALAPTSEHNHFDALAPTFEHNLSQYDYYNHLTRFDDSKLDYEQYQIPVDLETIYSYHGLHPSSKLVGDGIGKYNAYNYEYYHPSQDWKVRHTETNDKSRNHGVEPETNDKSRNHGVEPEAPTKSEHEDNPNVFENPTYMNYFKDIIAQIHQRELQDTLDLTSSSEGYSHEPSEYPKGRLEQFMAAYKITINGVNKELSKSKPELENFNHLQRSSPEAVVRRGGRGRRSVQEATVHAEECHARNLIACGKPALEKILMEASMRSRCQAREEFLNCMTKKRHEFCMWKSSPGHRDHQNVADSPKLKDMRMKLKKGFATTCSITYSTPPTGIKPN